MKQLKSIILFVLFILINTLCSRSNNVENSTENSNDYSSTIVDLKENSENINTSFFVSAEIDSLFLNEICERRFNYDNNSFCNQMDLAIKRVTTVDSFYIVEFNCSCGSPCLIKTISTFNDKIEIIDMIDVQTECDCPSECEGCGWNKLEIKSDSTFKITRVSENIFPKYDESGNVMEFECNVERTFKYEHYKINSNGSFQLINSQKKMDIEIPEHYEIIDSTKGDLDNDGIAEKVVVYESDIQTDLGTERHMYIYKKINQNWDIWGKTIGAILPSEHGGILGDPFQKIDIKRNCIVIDHFGGSREKWNYTHRYRFQNDKFHLIGATIIIESPCDYIESFDYNLSTAKASYSIKNDNCENGTKKEELKKEFSLQIQQLPLMDGFYPGNNNSFIPDSSISMYY
jgi:hypothetical protein